MLIGLTLIHNAVDGYEVARVPIQAKAALELFRIAEEKLVRGERLTICVVLIIYSR